jgi:predicted amidohydrolase YtcJ
MRRLAAIGVIGVVQPLYIEQLGDEWEAMPAAPRLRSVPLRDLLDAGISLAGNLSGEIGVLRPGARADLVVLSAYPLDTPPASFDCIRVERTILGGATVFLRR